MGCAGQVGYTFVKQGYRTRKHPDALKMPYLPISLNHFLVGLTYYGLARVAAHRGNAGEAAQLGQQALAQFEAIRHHKAREVAAWLQAQPESAS